MLYIVRNSLFCSTRYRSSFFFPYHFFSFFRAVKWIVKSIKNRIFDTSFFSLLIEVTKASEVTKDICAVCGEDAIAERIARDWFARFKRGNFDLNDAPRSGRPIKMDGDQSRWTETNSVIVAIGSVVSSKVLSGNGKPLILLFWGKFMWDPSSKLLSKSHRLKVTRNCRKITFHLFT